MANSGSYINNSPSVLALIAYSDAVLADSLAVRDGNANLKADAFVPGLSTTTAAAGNTTLTVDSTEVQVVTGTTTHTLILPTTTVAAGRRFLIINQSTGAVTVKSSDLSTVIILSSAQLITMVTALQDTPTASTHWAAGYLMTTAAQTGAVSGTIAQRSGGNLLNAGRMVPSSGTIATTGGTRNMVWNDVEVQICTGTSNHTVNLPTTNVAGAGERWTIINNSTGTITVNSSAGNLVKTLAAGERVTVIALQAAPTANTHWSAG